ncbi:transposase family protein [Streptomyces sp. NPDC056663]|uniref:transposase family protein n=1 Tax=Streptomyces sp. NPDC056663 TaxID=3345899 RepID=UPI0036A168E8
MKLTWARTACTRPALSGVSRAHFGESLEELAPPWAAARASALHVMRGGPRKRAEGVGRKPCLVFTDRLAATLVHLRLGLPHAALAELYGVDPSTVSAAIREVRPLLAARGFAIPDRPGLRIRTLDDLFAYAEAEGVDIRLDGTEVQVRRPRVGRAGRKAIVSGKERQNTIKTTTFSDHQGRTLFSGVVRPGRMHDQTAVRTEGIAEQFLLHLDVRGEVDSGYQGLAKERPPPVSAPPKKPTQDSPDGDKRAWREARRRQSSARIVVEHTNAEYKQWHPLQRCTGRREDYGQTHLAIAGLVSDRAGSTHDPPPHGHRTRARSRDGLLNHPPAEPPDQHDPTSIFPKVVRRRVPDRPRPAHGKCGAS